MATSFSTFAPATIVSSGRNPNQTRIKAAAASSSSASWWTPLFGWSSDPDYIQHSTSNANGSFLEASDPPESEKSRSRFAPGCFTEEKAKQLRMKTLETASFHDIMYHSAIASRLASDISGR